jgi:DNA-binding winged helix-turn-helix (wHTH) protein
VDVTFGVFRLDARTRQLLRGTRPVHLSPKAFNLLALLVQQRPAAISKAEIHQRLWPDTFVSDGNVAVLIAEIREALSERARQPTFVRTVHRFGYAFAEAPAGSAGRRASALRCWLAWGSERAPLTSGENVVGRDSVADIRVDAVGVSRRHAMITVAGEAVTLRDLSSKNGTFADEIRVTSPVPLIDGAQIRLGPLPMQFRQLRDVRSTQTLDPSRATKGLW